MEFMELMNWGRTGIESVDNVGTIRVLLEWQSQSILFDSTNRRPLIDGA